ncbi:ABC transporter substrate-binding protein [Pseudomonas sp. LRF_L74]|uniref:ABC transporter substrate-binding protein n=1 Tax=Pseudomonas sp. LRF_L74 TaxID=3369422 RepID=UPI003F645491
MNSHNREVLFTICPVFVASHIAVELGWLDEELARIGASARFLRSLETQYWPAHFNQRSDRLFRDGGCIPAIWANAQAGQTVLLGLTRVYNGGQILVRADADIHSLADLAGARIGLPRNPANPVDWWRAVSQRALQTALRLGHLRADQVKWVDVDYPPASSRAPCARPIEHWRDLSRHYLAFAPEVRAAEEGRVDAIYSGQGKSLILERSGLFKVIEDFNLRPDWTLQVANSPFALTVSRALAQQQPDLVIAYLRACIRAGRWINQNKPAAAYLINRLTYHPSVADTLQAIEKIDFVPNLDAHNLAAIGLAKGWLRELGYIQQDFTLDSWADSSFLLRAHEALE